MKRLFLLLAVLTGAVVLWSVLPGVRPSAARSSIVLVTIDTMRADRLGRGFTPALDALAASGRRFEQARASVPLTLPSHVTLMTGTLPPVHGVRDNGVVFGGTVPTLARILRDAGYQTGAFVGAYVLDGRFGLADGFDVYDDRVPRDPAVAARLEAERRASEVVDAAIAWLDGLSAPYFLWVHLYDPHAPYDPPAEFRAAAGGDPYDGEIAYADAQVGRLFGALRSRGLMGEAVVVVTGDHGEGLGEHGEQTHGMLAYDTTLRVPLIVSAPRLSPEVVHAPVSLADVAPSLLQRAGLRAALSPRASDVDLFGTVPAGRDVYAESRYPLAAGWHPLSVLSGEQWKLVMSSEAELFDIVADPHETKNLAPVRPAVVQGMQSRLSALQAAETAAPTAAVSPEVAARLRALGYAGGGATAQPVADDAPNPAGVIEAWTRFEGALGMLTEGRAADALADLETLAREFPAGPVFQSTYARALLETGRSAAALAVYRATVERWPGNAAHYHDLAVAARAAGHADEAMRAEQAALALDANSPSSLNGLGLLHADAGRPAEAAAAFERAAAADPSNASYWVNLGNARREMGQLAAAESAYRRALEADATFADAANGLGVLLVQQARPAEAVAWFERALAHSPDFHEARLNLGIAYQESGDRQKAAQVYRDILSTRGAAGTREHQAAEELLRGLR